MQIDGISIHGTYGTARTAASVFAAIGWIAFALGLLATVQAGLAGLIISFGGLCLVAIGQGLRAAVDIADYTRQSLLIQVASASGMPSIDLSKPARSMTQPLQQSKHKTAPTGPVNAARA